MTVAEERFTIDALAAVTGLTTRTIRFYTGRGLLPPPAMDGRTGYYGAQHRRRLDLVRDMQQGGIALGVIERRLGEIPVDRKSVV